MGYDVSSIAMTPPHLTIPQGFESRKKSPIVNGGCRGAQTSTLYRNITFCMYTGREHDLERTRLNIAVSYKHNDKTKKGMETINDPLK